MTQNIFALSLKFIAIDIIGEVFYFPLWWYGRGILNTIRWCLGSLKSANKKLGVTIWLANVLTPMYGQYDFAGRVISFFMRIAQIIFRTALLFLWLIFLLIVFLFYLVLPLFTTYQIIAQIFIY